MTSYHSLSLTNSWNVEKGWPIFPHRPQMFPFRNTGKFLWIFSNHRTHGPLDESASNCHFFSVKTGHSFHPRSNMAFLMKTVYHGWWLVVVDGPSQKKWIVIVSLTPCPIQGAVMPASCASIADEPTWLRHQMVLNHHGHYVTVIILTCPEWWGKVGQSDVCWVNMMTNKDSRFDSRWAKTIMNYECQTSQCGFRVVNAECISKVKKYVQYSINDYESVCICWYAFGQCICRVLIVKSSCKWHYKRTVSPSFPFHF